MHPLTIPKQHKITTPTNTRTCCEGFKIKRESGERISIELVFKTHPNTILIKSIPDNPAACVYTLLFYGLLVVSSQVWSFMIIFYISIFTFFQFTSVVHFFLDVLANGFLQHQHHPPCEILESEAETDWWLKTLVMSAWHKLGRAELWQ